MNRKKRTEILIKSNENVAKMLADSVRKKYEIKVIEEPNQGLVMIKMRETAQKELFYLGEVLVTEAKVYVNGALGMGIVKGENEELAMNLAIIDGAYKANIEELELWREILIKAQKEIEACEKREASKILETKVDFSTMDV